jgi:hypothetical protein
MPRPKTSRRDRKPPKAATGARTEGNASVSFQTLALSGMAAKEMLIESLIRDLEKGRKLALSKGRSTAAVTMTLAIRRLLRLLPEPGRRPSLH